MCKINKKAQFGPDLVVSVALIILIGLGGVFFMNTFISGIQFKSVMNVFDVETDTSCGIILSSLVGDEYVRSGVRVDEGIYEGTSYEYLQNYFGGYNEKVDYSASFEKKIENINEGYSCNSDGCPNLPAKLRTISVYGVLGRESSSFGGSTHFSEKLHDMYTRGNSRICQMGIYSPSGLQGVAYLQIVMGEGQ